jgi:hypothetical protein
MRPKFGVFNPGMNPERVAGENKLNILILNLFRIIRDRNPDKTPFDFF